VSPKARANREEYTSDAVNLNYSYNTVCASNSDNEHEFTSVLAWSLSSTNYRGRAQ